MDPRSTRQFRLMASEPYLLFRPPATARVQGQVQHPAPLVSTSGALWANCLWELDNGLPPAFAVQGVPYNMAEAIVWDAQGSPAVGPPAVRELQYIHPYAWAAFAPAVNGEVVPRGFEEFSLQMPPPNADPDRLRVLRFRYRGTVNAPAAAGSGDGTVGPFALISLSRSIVPGTMVVTAPRVAGGNSIARDLPWPKGEQWRDLVEGRMIGDVNPGVDSIINYQTGVVTITFDQAIVNAPNNITEGFEDDYAPQPLDIELSWSALMQ